MNKHISKSLYNNKVKGLRGYPFPVIVVGLIFLYALFALDRIKNILAPTIEGSSTTNEIWILPLFCLMIFVYNSHKSGYKINKSNLFLVITILLYIIIILIGGLHVGSISQYIYAILLFVIPILLFFPLSKIDYRYIEKFIKYAVLISLIYSIFAIVLTTNYAFFNNLVGNSIDNYRYYSQYRPSMMLGSSITVSYYLNLTLPLSFHLYFNSIGNKWKLISILAVISNIMATFVLLSRIASISIIFIILCYLLVTKRNRKNLKRKMSFLSLAVLATIYIMVNYDLSRLMNGLNLTGDSAIERVMASKLGIYIFTEYPIFGSGMGRFFERVYDNKYITVDEVTGLIDPHNLYVLIISELGSVGLLVTIILILFLFKSFSHIKDNLLRYTAYISLLVFLFNSMGGSHLLNEISYSTIFWIYMGMFQAISIKDKNNSYKRNTEYDEK